MAYTDLMRDSSAIRNFWNHKVRPIISNLTENNFRFPKIQTFFNENLEMISQVCNNMSSFNIRPLLNSSYTSIVREWEIYKFFACSIEKKVERRWWFFKKVVKNPWIIVNVCDLFKVHLQMSAEMFESMVITATMHELDHLALDKCGPSSDFATMLDHERLAWARTCENTLASLFVFYGRVITPNDALAYSMWLQCGRNAENDLWKNYIYHRYSSFS